MFTCRLYKAKYFGNATSLRTHVERHHPEIKDVDEEQPKVVNIPVDQRTLHRCSKLPAKEEERRK